MYGYYKQQNGEIEHKKTWTRLQKGNLIRGNDSLLIAVQKDAIMTNYIKMKIIYNIQQNSKYRLYGERNETINHIVSECLKLAKKSTILEMTGWEIMGIVQENEFWPC